MHGVGPIEGRGPWAGPSGDLPIATGGLRWDPRTCRGSAGRPGPKMGSCADGAGQRDQVDAVEGLQVDARRRAEAVSRRQMAQVAAFIRDYVFGFAESCIGPSGVQVGVRETRGPSAITSSPVRTS